MDARLSKLDARQRERLGEAFGDLVEAALGLGWWEYARDVILEAVFWEVAVDDESGELMLRAHDSTGYAPEPHYFNVRPFADLVLTEGEMAADGELDACAHADRIAAALEELAKGLRRDARMGRERAAKLEEKQEGETDGQ